MFSEAKVTKKDVLADLVSVKYDVQTCLSETSLRKAFLTSSEDDVKADMNVITEKLSRLLKKIHDNARHAASKLVKEAQEKVNDEILYLEELHQSIEDTEEHVKMKTSNTNMKPLELGKEKYSSTRAALDQFKASVSTKRASFILHPVLTKILEDVDQFTLGKTVVMETEGSDFEDSFQQKQRNTPSDNTGQRRSLKDPFRTSFVRSNTPKIIKQAEESQGARSRRGSGSDNGEKPVCGLSYRSSLADKKSNLLSKRSKTNDSIPSYSGISNSSGNENDSHAYRAVAGLKATLADRSHSQPLLKLTSPTDGVFMPEIKEEQDVLQFQYLNSFETKTHKTGCYISGIATLEDGSIVVCDGPHDSLQLFDAQLQAVSEMECQHPWGACAVSDAAVAVTLHYAHKLILVKTGHTLEKVNEKDIHLKCSASLTYDVKFHAFRLYVLCSDGDMHVLDLKGKEFSVIKTNIRTNVLKFIDIDHESELLAVSGENLVLVYSSGLPLWQLNEAGRSKMLFTGVLIADGRVLVCDWENYRIADVYDNGTKVRTVIGENLDRPVAVVLHRSSGMVLVSQGDYDMEPGRTRQIRMFQLEKKTR